ncbi:olfactory receptor 6B1-like [Aquarana catesbeiana]|uniref:olfactory receptor 6B1-like n=1 Tax=Aquarana catesbeiana TaxID=8400 RepID=UPI003CC99DDE
MANKSEVFHFILVGFPGLPEKFYAMAASVIICVYSLSLCANITAIMIILLKAHLHQPMYIIILNLAVSDLIFDTATLPNMIVRYFTGDGTLSFTGCLFQMGMVHSLNLVDSLTIMLMAFDRYVAICKPLRYHSIITKRVAMALCGLVWLVASSIGLFVMSWALPLPFCGPNRILLFYCSLAQVTVLSCTDTSAIRRNGFYAGIIMHVGPFTLNLISYIVIIASICLTSRSENWKKLYNTCIAHWFVITLFYLPRVIDYGIQAQILSSTDVFVLLSCLYAFIPHFSSPIIFCLRTQEIRKTLRKILSEKKL